MSDKFTIRMLQLMKDCNFPELIRALETHPGELEPHVEAAIARSLVACPGISTNIALIAKDRLEDATRAIERMKRQGLM